MCLYIEQIDHDLACSIELWMHAGGWESTKKASCLASWVLQRVSVPLYKVLMSVDHPDQST